jgi:hypothetical protein
VGPLVWQIATWQTSESTFKKNAENRLGICKPMTHVCIPELTSTMDVDEESKTHDWFGQFFQAITNP